MFLSAARFESHEITGGLSGVDVVRGVVLRVVLDDDNDADDGEAIEAKGGVDESSVELDVIEVDVVGVDLAVRDGFDSVVIIGVVDGNEDGHERSVLDFLEQADLIVLDVVEAAIAVFVSYDHEDSHESYIRNFLERADFRYIEDIVDLDVDSVVVPSVNDESHVLDFLEQAEVRELY
ncbi:hypothetical protein N7510_008138 [Penicillium lagena]|uniref:uncharacterized protein n=1 Tax=Penicillium lagena TaxID=94218 RepID=UPI0025411126|nr:uncharacterized protein N7510_008138 [Penicillium lagena]KAJ5611419.1 hypothetical protein N7510_008138 [Penicillium lagena]